MKAVLMILSLSTYSALGFYKNPKGTCKFLVKDSNGYMERTTRDTYENITVEKCLKKLSKWIKADEVKELTLKHSTMGDKELIIR
jgi:hypothetical protein